MTLHALVEAAWRDHADQSEAVAARLADALALLQGPQDYAPFTRLVTHVYGEHLGQWQRGIDLLESASRLPAFAPGSDADAAVRRGIAVLRLGSGEHAALDRLAVEDRTYALAAAADALGARGDVATAVDFLEQALACAPASLPGDHPAARALAICGNNLSAVLEGKSGLSPDETGAMLAAAACGLRFWKLAGTWLEEERAHYQLARCQLRAGDAAAARTSIDGCIDVCERNDAPPFERFFGHAVRALAARAQGDDAAFEASRRAALAQYALVPEGDRTWCARELGEIGGAA
jgi:tetratricopeptide (TPR) repeat protein